ncbi:hypothetical protein HYW67_03255 [Candidatus Parcubacteria bacterium]|nr:hypothetical protein [Candidatus Parcubacteria bacterium]
MALADRSLPASVDDLYEIHFDTAHGTIRLWDRNHDVIRGWHADGSFRDDKIRCVNTEAEALVAILDVLERLGHRFDGTTDIDEAPHGIWVLRRVE